MQQSIPGSSSRSEWCSSSTFLSCSCGTPYGEDDLRHFTRTALGLFCKNSQRVGATLVWETALLLPRALHVEALRATPLRADPRNLDGGQRQAVGLAEVTATMGLEFRVTFAVRHLAHRRTAGADAHAGLASSVLARHTLDHVLSQRAMHVEGLPWQGALRACVGHTPPRSAIRQAPNAKRPATWVGDGLRWCYARAFLTSLSRSR